MRLTLLQGQYQAQSWGNAPLDTDLSSQRAQAEGTAGAHSLQSLGFSALTSKAPESSAHSSPK